MRIDCDIIKDLLPLYVEGLVSEKSKTVIEEHLKECESCQKLWQEMKKPEPQVRYDREPAESFRKYVKKEKRKLGIKTALVTAAIILAVGAVRVFLLGGAFGLLLWDSANAEVFEDTDISHYSRYMGEDAEEEYVKKWDMDESIFPEKITEKMCATDYKMVYYNPWDAQYLSYLVVEYDETVYHEEVKRLKKYASTEYLGYYGAEGFSEGCTLLAMEADPYHGFVYALETGERQIVYVELIFCNYFYDLDYQRMIPEKYLPAGFDATRDNPYRKEMLGE